MADFCGFQEKKDGRLHFQHMLGVWPVQLHFHLPALNPEAGSAPLPCLLWACSAITQLRCTIRLQHLMKPPLGQVSGQSTQQHLGCNSWPWNHPCCPFPADGYMSHPLLWQAGDTVNHMGTCSLHQHEPVSCHSASQGQQSSLRLFHISCTTKSTHTSSYHSSANAQEQGNDFIITCQIISLLHTQLLHFRCFQIRSLNPNCAHVQLGTSSVCWCQKTAEDNLPEKFLLVPPHASKHSVNGASAPQRTELMPWSLGCWASPAFQGHLLQGSARCTVRCQQLCPLQNKKPLSGINALGNYLPHERKSAFSQGDSRTLGLCMLSSPFHS